MKLAIISAMEEENRHLIAKLNPLIAVTTSGSRTFYEGKLFGMDVVLAMSRWGKVAAATTVTQAIIQHAVDAVLFTGVAGGIDKGLKVGDIVIADSLVQHDMDASPFFRRFEVPLLGKSNFLPHEGLADRLESGARKFLDESLREHVNARELAEFQITKPQVVRGLVASGDRFFASQQAVDALIEALPNVLCVEMEGAAAAQVCHEHEIPFCLVRTISDSANAEALSDFPRFIQSVASGYSLGIVQEFINSCALMTPLSRI